MLLLSLGRKAFGRTLATTAPERTWLTPKQMLFDLMSLISSCFSKLPTSILPKARYRIPLVLSRASGVASAIICTMEKKRETHNGGGQRKGALLALGNKGAFQISQDYAV